MERLAQGQSISVFYANLAMSLTFSNETWELFRSSHPEFKDSKLFAIKDLTTIIIYYLDDILLMTPKTWDIQQHFILLNYFFWAITHVGLKISLKKSQILTEKNTFIGQNIDLTKNTTFLDPNKARVFSQWRRPLSSGELISRLSILSYYSKYLGILKVIAAPLFELSKQGTYEWTTIHENS